MNNITYNVPNINCQHCVHTIQNEIGDLEGVQSVNADLTTKKVTVQYSAPTTEQIIEDTLKEINYPAQK